jgi:hypothetical protein
MLSSDPQRPKAIQQPPQTLGGQDNRLPAIPDVDVGGGASAGEHVAVLPLRGNFAALNGLQTGAHDGLVLILGVAIFGLTLRRAFPMLRQQADHRLAAGVGPVQRLLPPLSGPNPGVRVQVQKNLLGQPRLLLGQPRLDRDRLTAIPAGMTQKHPRHHSPLLEAAAART